MREGIEQESMSGKYMRKIDKSAIPTWQIAVSAGGQHG